MKRQISFRVVAVLIVMLAASINVDAQIGGALKKAQNAVKKTEKTVTNNERAVKSTDRSIKNTERSVKSTEKTVTGNNKSVNSSKSNAKNSEKQQVQDARQAPSTEAPTTTDAPSTTETTPATTETATQTSSTQQVGKQPSAEAIAADPRASVTTVEEGYTKSPAEIRAAYEILCKADPDYPNKPTFFFPYYHPYLHKYYYLTDSPAEIAFFSKSGKSLDAHRSKSRKRSGYLEDEMKIRLLYVDAFEARPEYVADTIPAGNRTPWGCIDDCIGIMPVGIHVISAGYALFLADPEGLKPFMRLCEATNAGNAYTTSINITGGNDGRTLNSRPEKLTVKWEHVESLSRAYKDRIDAASKDITPMSVIRDAATYYKNELAKYDAAKDVANTRYYFHLFEVAMYYWQESSKKADLAKEMDDLFVQYVRYAKRYTEWAEAAKLDAPPIEMPRTYTMNAALAAKALEVAKSQFENRTAEPFKVDRIVFLTDKWSEAREQAWPNRVVMRTTQVGVLTNQDGKWVIRQWTLQQDSDLKGGFVETYRYVAGDNYQPKRVNYKP